MTQQKKVVHYLVMILSLFAKEKEISLREAFLYLDRYGGVSFLMDHYSAEHLLPVRDVLEDVTQICRRSGGNL